MWLAMLWIRVSDIQDAVPQGLTLGVFTETFCSTMNKVELTVILQAERN